MQDLSRLLSRQSLRGQKRQDRGPAEFPEDNTNAKVLVSKGLCSHGTLHGCLGASTYIGFCTADVESDSIDVPADAKGNVVI